MGGPGTRNPTTMKPANGPKIWIILISLWGARSYDGVVIPFWEVLHVEDKVIAYKYDFLYNITHHKALIFNMPLPRPH